MANVFSRIDFKMKCHRGTPAEEWEQCNCEDCRLWRETKKLGDWLKNKEGFIWQGSKYTPPKFVRDDYYYDWADEPEPDDYADRKKEDKNFKVEDCKKCDKKECKKCTCSLEQIMRGGCKCGAMDEERKTRK